MGKNEVYLLFLLISFSVSILLTVWLVKRGKPERRIHWFIGCSVFSMFLLGIISGPVAILLSLGILAFLKKDEDRPLNDISNGFFIIFSSGLSISFYLFYMLLSVGALYWLWMAIQLKSFLMFLVGLFPFFMIITGPVGAYSLLFGTPEWVYNWFA
ncbi:hypothetical protein [Shewanella putrefaciens]|uniref:Tripartite tricarboxylate transporter TctB family protein n=1 Tax=Shewanella putrefaciens TaxID=24 RepID=A0ABX8XE39_SHEPU|nr:hypothetical protein [Shewanella putrefaciens]AVV83762.1 hypothetical protein SPWS13_1969 [Shewanella putrefaciens]MCT8943460.1 hypothetical protein [Shewanella putrefaciens]QSE50061.1 hypothetical protein JW975_03350 [Shewanella putrefaciens]QYX73470.1 hypothetical protein K3G22_03345 [Shewanella putrefaciens]GGN20613.1 hypothetical protein GCM10007984_20190 [Shewanella putrefaciens]